MKKLNKLLSPSISHCKANVEKFDEDILLKFTAKKVAFKIFYELKRRQLNQNDLAKLLNVTPQNVSKLLKGEDYKISTLVKLEQVLDINFIDRDIYKEPHIQFITIEFVNVNVLKDYSTLLNYRTADLAEFFHIADKAVIFNDEFTLGYDREIAYEI
ncbi:helix-turn-helix domain-containing protein [Sphingobacterium sp. MYb382]|uniref:helix-turn-helix domain-containing protein n=1 Tax=Sphingobacterium sp. MYb382 TaxID=2745278 RepID=UPI003098F77C